MVCSRLFLNLYLPVEAGSENIFFIQRTGISVCGKLFEAVGRLGDERNPPDSAKEAAFFPAEA